METKIRNNGNTVKNITEDTKKLISNKNLLNNQNYVLGKNENKEILYAYSFLTKNSLIKQMIFPIRYFNIFIFVFYALKGSLLLGFLLFLIFSTFTLIGFFITKQIYISSLIKKYLIIKKKPLIFNYFWLNTISHRGRGRYGLSMSLNKLKEVYDIKSK